MNMDNGITNYLSARDVNLTVKRGRLHLAKATFFLDVCCFIGILPYLEYYSISAHSIRFYSTCTLLELFINSDFDFSSLITFVNFRLNKGSFWCGK